MEEDQEFKHVCKFCNKNFPCGRSLGGHMRSHLINNNNNNNNSAENDGKLIINNSRSNNKLSSANNGGIKITSSPSPPSTTCFEAAGVLHPGYGLRENPKKTWRIADSSTEDTNSLPDKFCKECGKAFQSWKALFGHMKCHSEKERISNSFEEQDSWTSGNHHQKQLVMDSQSDNETTTTAPNRRRRSRRRTTRYLGTTANSSSFSTIPNASSSLNSDVADEQEQEEIAMCLMMLSRDVGVGGHWVGSGGGLKSVAESSDNSSVFLETTPISKTSRITILDAKEATPKLKKLLNGKEPGKLNSSTLVLEGRQTEFCGVSSGFRKNLSRMNRTESSIDGFFKKDKIIKKSKIDENEACFGKGTELDEAAELGGGGSANKLNNSNKRTIHDDYDPELRSDSLKKLANGSAFDCEIRKSSQKRSKFECTTCNKIFHSYQALGGHRASHKKIKGCFASKIESSENGIEFETDISPEPIIAESKPIKNSKIENNSIDNIMAGGGGGGDEEKADQAGARSRKISKGHECPICLKVFSSGQALGGHKRSHLIGGGSEAKSNHTIVIQKPIPEIRDFLDLNLPAPVEEENNGGHVASLKPWWVGNCSHKREGLVGLISN